MRYITRWVILKKMAIKYKCKETEKIWRGIASKKLTQAIQQIARRKLRMLNAAEELEDMKVPPGNKLELLKGKRKGQYSIRINDQWRIWLFGVMKLWKLKF